MKKISLGHKEKGILMLVDDEDFNLLSKYSWYRDSYGYACATIPLKERGCAKVKRLKAHRLIMDAPRGMQVDHINHENLDNRKENLRICTHQQNLLNKLKTRGSSKYKGVSWFARDKNWLAKVGFNYRQIYLGYFDSEEKAALAYDIKARELFGEYAKLNYESLYK